jgi:SAM-dependent methyltransferase
MIEIAQSIQQIEQRIKDINDLTAWSPVPSGSVLRVHAYSYPAWGILLTVDNQLFLYTRSNSDYSVEWKDTDEASNVLVAQGGINAGLSDVNAIMNSFVGQYAAEVAIAAIKENSIFTSIDVGSGTGPSTLAMLESFYEIGGALNPDCNLVLIEPSEKRQEVARDAITNLVQDAQGKDFQTSLTMIPETDVDALSEMRAECADLVIQNASIHHNAFNRHLLEINRVLKPGAPFISGDWHNSMWETPARTYWLLYLLQDPQNDKIQSEVLESIVSCPIFRIRHERPELREFRKYFSLDEATLKSAFNNLSQSEKQANAGIIKFWLEVGKLFLGKGKRSPIFFLESHERVTKRVEALTNARFVFDAECNSKYKEVLRSKGRGELATVMVAKKQKR